MLSNQYCRVLDEKSTKATCPRANRDSCFCRSISIATQCGIFQFTFLNFTIKYDVPDIIDWICITTLTQTLSPPYSCIPVATHLHCQPMRPSSKLNACADAIRQQPADRQLKCSFRNLPQISGANIAASWHHCKHLPTPGSYSAAAIRQQQ